MGAESSHDGRRQVVLAVDAARIAARHQKKGGRAVDHDTSSVRISPHARSVLDVELEADKARHLIQEPRRVILTATAFRESLGLHAVLAGIHQHEAQRNHCPAASLPQSDDFLTFRLDGNALEDSFLSTASIWRTQASS